MIKTSTLSILALALTSAGCSMGSSGGDDESEPNIIGGVDDFGDPAVGILRNFRPDGLSACTASLISPRVLVTAAHCTVEGGSFDVSFDLEPNLQAPLGSNGFVRGIAITSPEFTGNPEDGHDIAVVLLSRNVQIKPLTIGATPPRGALLRAVGYGMDEFGQDGEGIGTKRQVRVQINEVREHEIVTGSEGASTCHGDSGGPFIDAKGNLVATTSYGDDADCHGSSHDMRIDDNLDFLGNFIDIGGIEDGGDDDGDDDDGGNDDDGNDDGGDDDGGNDDGGDDDGGGVNSCSVSVNGREVSCVNGECTCSVNGTEIGTCTADDESTACSVPGNCCGF